MFFKRHTLLEHSERRGVIPVEPANTQGPHHLWYLQQYLVPRTWNRVPGTWQTISRQNKSDRRTYDIGLEDLRSVASTVRSTRYCRTAKLLIIAGGTWDADVRRIYRHYDVLVPYYQLPGVEYDDRVPGINGLTRAANSKPAAYLQRVVVVFFVTIGFRLCPPVAVCANRSSAIPNGRHKSVSTDVCERAKGGNRVCTVDETLTFVVGAT